eukprot:INCI13455.7.p1 GENE.INCI13455.7~~INCI13455.7.p1  ORF type:complete len:1086 (-),score=145.47 INCI13455.7:1924-4998(-)
MRKHTFAVLNLFSVWHIRGFSSAQCLYSPIDTSNECHAREVDSCNLELCAEFTSIDLSMKYLRGTLPAVVGSLSNLRTLQLGDNAITGAIPASFGSLAGLGKLDLNRNLLSGAVPVSLGSLKQLYYMDFDTNAFTGSVPANLLGVSTLTYVSMNSNLLTGSLPPSLGSALDVVELWMGENKLTGQVPPQLGSLTRLVKLDLGGNQLSGTLPSSIGSLLTLTRLNLADNSLSGAVPESFCNLVLEDAGLNRCALACTGSTQCGAQLSCPLPDLCATELQAQCGLCSDTGTAVAGSLLGIVIFLALLFGIFFWMRRKGLLVTIGAGFKFNKSVTEGLIERTPAAYRVTSERLEQMQAFLSGRLSEIILPTKSVNLRNDSPIVAFGGNGRVYRCELLKTAATHPSAKAGTHVALKELFSMMGFAGQVDEFAKELQFLYKLQHRHIVPFFGLYISNAYEGATSKRYFLVTKFAEKGHLGEHLTTRSIGFAARKRWCLEIASAIAYLHSNLVVHRDIKPENVLVDEDDRCMLTDFGVARSLEQSGMMTGRMGTVQFMPPEALDGDDSYPHPFGGTRENSPAASPSATPTKRTGTSLNGDGGGNAPSAGGGQKDSTVVALGSDVAVTAHWPVAEPISSRFGEPSPEELWEYLQLLCAGGWFYKKGGKDKHFTAVPRFVWLGLSRDPSKPHPTDAIGSSLALFWTSTPEEVAKVERKIPPQDAVADVFGLQKLTAAYRPSIRAKSLELSKVAEMVVGPPKLFLVDHDGSPVQVIDGLRSGPVAIDTRGCVSFVHRKEVQSAAPYKSSVNLVPYGPWDPTRQPRIRSVSADGWARAFAMLLSEGFGVHNAYVPAASYRDHDVPSTPPTPEKTPVQHIRALFSKAGNTIRTLYNRTPSSSDAASSGAARTAATGHQQVYSADKDALDVEESPNALVRHNEALKLRFAPAFDAYSFAVLVATIFNGEHPYKDLTPSLVLVKVLAGRLRPNLPTCLSPEAHAYLEQMWHRDPRQRPSFSDIVQKLEEVLVDPSSP